MTTDNDVNRNNNYNVSTRNQQQLRRSLQQAMTHRVASLTPAEEFFLHRLLVDEDATSGHLQNACKRLNDDILFSTLPPTTPAAASPDVIDDNNNDENPPASKPRLLIPPPRPFLPPSHRKAKRHSTVGLWKAHQAGVAPERLRCKSAGAAAAT